MKKALRRPALAIAIVAAFAAGWFAGYRPAAEAQDFESIMRQLEEMQWFPVEASLSLRFWARDEISTVPASLPNFDCGGDLGESGELGCLVIWDCDAENAASFAEMNTGTSATRVYDCEANSRLIFGRLPPLPIP